MTTPLTDALSDLPRRPIVRAARSGRAFDLFSGPQIAMIGQADTDGAYELIEIDALPGMGPPLHVHREFDESFYVLDGDLTLRINGVTHVVGPRGVAVVPAGAVHTWKNATDKTVRFLQFTVPGGMEPLSAAMAAETGKLTPERLIALADKHGTTVVGPPL